MNEDPGYLGKFKGQDVTFDGITVRTGAFSATLDFELSGDLRAWLHRRDVDLPANKEEAQR